VIKVNKKIYCDWIWFFNQSSGEENAPIESFVSGFNDWSNLDFKIGSTDFHFKIPRESEEKKE
jgi:hypothetical protein